MYAAFMFMGALFGLALSLTVGLFYVLSLGGDFKANLRATGLELQKRVTGRRTYTPAVSGERRVETDNRIRSLQEELRVANRLLEQSRQERESHAQQLQKAADQTQQLEHGVTERDARILALEAELKEHGPRQEALRQQLADCMEQLSRVSRQVKDLETEIDVLQSGVDVVS